MKINKYILHCTHKAIKTILNTNNSMLSVAQ